MEDSDEGIVVTVAGVIGGGCHSTRKDEEKDWYVLPHRVLAQLELTVAI